MKPQQGVTLVGLMVGIALSSFILLAMLTIYQNALGRVFVSTTSASDNAERSSGMLLASHILQGAGFGVNDPQTPQDLLELNDLQLSGGSLASGSSAPTPTATRSDLTPPPADGGAGTHLSDVILWGQQAAGAYTCEGLATAATDTGHGLFHLSSADACSSVQSDWQSITWSARPLAWHGYLAIDGLSPSEDQWLGLQLNNTACWPFGIQPSESHPTGAITATLSYPIFNVNGVSQQTLTNTTCLINFKS